MGAEGLLHSLLAVQGEATTLPKDATNPHFKSKYTPLDTIVEKIGPLLHKHGLVWSALPVRDEHGEPALNYRLAHAGTGEVLEGTMPLLLSKQDAQGQGSAITYARRYALCAVLNLVADDDDDGARAAQGKAQQDHGRPATEKQLDFVKKLFKEKNLKTVAEIKPVLIYAGVPESLAADPKAAMEAMTGAWASNIIGVLTKGPVPTGASDVPPPADGDFQHAPAGEELFDPSVAQ